MLSRLSQFGPSARPLPNVRPVFARLPSQSDLVKALSVSLWATTFLVLGALSLHFLHGWPFFGHRLTHELIWLPRLVVYFSLGAWVIATIGVILSDAIDSDPKYQAKVGRTWLWIVTLIYATVGGVLGYMCGPFTFSGIFVTIGSMMTAVTFIPVSIVVVSVSMNLLTMVLLEVVARSAHWTIRDVFLLSIDTSGNTDAELLRNVTLFVLFGVASIVPTFQIMQGWEARKIRLTEASSLDQLTGLYNRRITMRRLEYEIARSKRDAFTSIAAIAVDLDHFKSINDTYGHATGDEVLRYAAGVLARSVRRGDVVGRIGGEEFLIITRVESIGEAIMLAERCRGQLQRKPITEREIFLTASFGIAVRRSDSVNARELLKRADAALYAAKAAGRNCVHIAERHQDDSLAPGASGAPEEGRRQESD